MSDNGSFSIAVYVKSRAASSAAERRHAGPGTTPTSGTR